MAGITNALNQTLHGQITPLSRGLWRLSDIIPCPVSNHDGQFYAAGYYSKIQPYDTSVLYFTLTGLKGA
jgi:hypothetical protein